MATNQQQLHYSGAQLKPRNVPISKLAVSRSDLIDTANITW